MTISQEMLLRAVTEKKSLEEKIAEIDVDLDKLKEIKSDLKAQVDSINKNVLKVMTDSNQKKVEYDFVRAMIPKARKNVVITDVTLIPEKYKKYETVEKIDKKELKKDIDSGVLIAGAELIDGEVTVKIEEL